jgi:hypothetical protein
MTDGPDDQAVFCLSSPYDAPRRLATLWCRRDAWSSHRRGVGATLCHEARRRASIQGDKARMCGLNYTFQSPWIRASGPRRTPGQRAPNSSGALSQQRIRWRRLQRRPASECCLLPLACLDPTLRFHCRMSEVASWPALISITPLTVSRSSTTAVRTEAVSSRTTDARTEFSTLAIAFSDSPWRTFEIRRRQSWTTSNARWCPRESPHHDVQRGDASPSVDSSQRIAPTRDAELRR